MEDKSASSHTAPTIVRNLTLPEVPLLEERNPQLFSPVKKFLQLHQVPTHSHRIFLDLRKAGTTGHYSSSNSSAGNLANSLPRRSIILVLTGLQITSTARLTETVVPIDERLAKLQINLQKRVG
jgi:hypothetical protein